MKNVYFIYKISKTLRDFTGCNELVIGYKGSGGEGDTRLINICKEWEGFKNNF